MQKALKALEGLQLFKDGKLDIWTLLLVGALYYMSERGIDVYTIIITIAAAIPKILDDVIGRVKGITKTAEKIDAEVKKVREEIDGKVVSLYDHFDELRGAVSKISLSATNRDFTKTGSE